MPASHQNSCDGVAIIMAAIVPGPWHARQERSGGGILSRSIHHLFHGLLVYPPSIQPPAAPLKNKRHAAVEQARAEFDPQILLRELDCGNDAAERHRQPDENCEHYQ